MTEHEHGTNYGVNQYADVQGLSGDRPWLLPSNRRLRHLQGISLRNLTLSRPSLHSRGKTTDDASLPNTLRTPTKALAQREAHKLEYSRSSNDLKSPPALNGSIYKKDEEEETLNGSLKKKPRPTDQKLRRRSTLNWTNALPEARQKKLENVAAERLADTWFSLHCSDIEEPVYVSEIVERAMNPSFRFFDLNTYGPWVTRRDELTIKYWARTAKTETFSMLIELQVNLRSLHLIGKTLENFRHPLPANCILLHLADGIYTSFTDLPHYESLASLSKPFRSTPQSILPTTSFDALMRLSNLDDCIQDALSTREKLSKQISAILEEQKTPRSKVTSALLASESSASTNRSLSAARRALHSAQSRRSDLQNSLKARREAISSGTLAQQKASSDLRSARAELCSFTADHGATKSALHGQIRRIGEDLLQIYPIEAIPDRPLNFTICGLSLPNATALTTSDIDPCSLAAALGHATHLTHLLSFYLSTPLPYPPSPHGSTSTIYDPVSTTLHSAQARTFPLYSKGAVQFRFEYGVFLLNSDIESLMTRRGIKLVDQRHTAGNLKMLLSVLTSGSGDTPGRKKGALKGLTPVEESGSSRERSDMEEWDVGLRGKGHYSTGGKQQLQPVNRDIPSQTALNSSIVSNKISSINPRKASLITSKRWEPHALIGGGPDLETHDSDPAMSSHSHSFAGATIQQHSVPARNTRSRAREREMMPRPRRKSSSLGAELRGDTGASALSTLEPTPTFPASPALSPRNSQNRVSRPFSKRRKARSYFRRWKDLSFRHTWVNPLILIIVALCAYAVSPTTSNPLHCAIFLSYPLPPEHSHVPTHALTGPDAPIYYGKGARDFAFVAFYIIVLSFTREFAMQRFIRPMAIRNGIRSRGKQNRFMEQVYTAMYFAVFGPFGLYVMSRTPVWYFNTKGMFADFPHRSHEGIFKAYYLLQASYWAQQAIVLCLQLEKPRKDFKELVGHHIVTLALIWLSYRFHFTYMGLAVYITHDISDFFLATSKTLNYLSSPIVIPYFTMFICIWIYLRHYVNLCIIYAIFTTFRTIGPFELNWETQQYKCWISQYITFGLLAFLQSINLFWLYFILRVAVNVVLKDDSTDVRSDDEGEVVDGKALERVEGGKKCMNGHTGAKKRVEAPNRSALNGTAADEPSYLEAVEGKKGK